MDLTDIVVAAAISGEGGGGADQIQSDWNQTDTTAKDFIKNKPIIPAETPIATTEIAGKVKPDGTTTTVDSNGVLSAIASGGDNVFKVVVGETDSQDLLDAINDGKLCYYSSDGYIYVHSQSTGAYHYFPSVRPAYSSNDSTLAVVGYILSTASTKVTSKGTTNVDLVGKMYKATTSRLGLVKPDGTTINVNSNGAINTVIPAPPTSDGQYVLSVVDGAYSWVSVPNANGNSF